MDFVHTIRPVYLDNPSRRHGISHASTWPCRQTAGLATYRQQNSQRIQQVSGWKAISGLKGGLFLLQQHHLDGLGVLRGDQAWDQ